MINFQKLNEEDLWKMFSHIIKEFKNREVIRSKNITGERGESVAINTYNKTNGLPKLQASPVGTKNIDAISRDGERYAIKTVMYPNKTTSVFYGMGSPKKLIKDKKFEYVIVVILNEFYEPELIIELNWENFLKNKKWHSRMRAFNISLSKKTIEESKIIYKKAENKKKQGESILI